MSLFSLGDSLEWCRILSLQLFAYLIVLYRFRAENFLFFTSMSDPAGGSDHLTGATTQSRQYEDERMERHSSQAKQGIVTP